MEGAAIPVVRVTREHLLRAPATNRDTMARRTMETLTRRALPVLFTLTCACATGEVTPIAPTADVVDVSKTDRGPLDVAPAEVGADAPALDATSDARVEDVAGDADATPPPDVPDVPTEAPRDVSDVPSDAPRDAPIDVTDAPADVADAPADVPEIEATWGTNAQPLGCTIGARHAYRCPPRGAASPIWGTDLYTQDSSVCTAGAHTGRITVFAGGVVVIETRVGAAGYIGSTRNGITSLSTGSWPCSFALP